MRLLQLRFMCAAVSVQCSTLLLREPVLCGDDVLRFQRGFPVRTRLALQLAPWPFEVVLSDLATSRTEEARNPEDVSSILEHANTMDVNVSCFPAYMNAPGVKDLRRTQVAVLGYCSSIVTFRTLV